MHQEFEAKAKANNDLGRLSLFVHFAPLVSEGGQHMLVDLDAPPRPSARLLARYCRSALGSLAWSDWSDPCLCNRRSGVILRFSYSAAIQGFSAAADTDRARGMRGGAARRVRR